MRHVSVLIALVLLLSCQGGAMNKQAAMLAAPPPDTVDWGNYTVSVGADKQVRQYLDAIASLVDIMNAPDGTTIKGHVNTLRKKLYLGHTEVETWARIMLAYRYAARGKWTSCKAELARPKEPKDHTNPQWEDFTANPPPHGTKVSALLQDIRTKNQARTDTDPPDKAAIEQSIQARETGSNPGLELNESWNRILLAAYIAEGPAGPGETWQRVKDELDHAE